MAEKKIELRLLTPGAHSPQTRYKYQNEVDMVVVRATTGDIGFLYGHVPCSVVLDIGVMRIIGGESDDLRLAVIGGVAQMEDNTLTIITETAEWPEDIDRSRAVARRDELLERIKRVDDFNERQGLRKELQAAELLITVSEFPPSGITRETE